MTARVELKRPDALSSAERDAWIKIQSRDPQLASPYFALGFLDAVAAVRGDVRVLVRTSQGVPQAFLPLQLDALGHARPLAGPLGDHHGLIAAPGARVDLESLLREAGVQVFDFFGWVGGRGDVGRHADYRDGSWVVDLSEGFGAFHARQKKIGGNTLRSILAARRKLGEAGHNVRFVFDDRRPESLEQLIAWKSAQYRATGHFDVFSKSWTRALVAALGASDGSAGAKGLISSLEIDGRLAAAHFGLLGEKVLHYWFPAYDSRLARAAPGNALIHLMLEALGERGIAEMHLGPGDYRYKAALGAWQIPLSQGFVATDGPAALLRRAAGALEQRAEGLPLGPVSRLPGRAFRRIDRIAGFRAA